MAPCVTRLAFILAQGDDAALAACLKQAGALHLSRITSHGGHRPRPGVVRFLLVKHVSVVFVQAGALLYSRMCCTVVSVRAGA